MGIGAETAGCGADGIGPSREIQSTDMLACFTDTFRD